MRFGDFTADKPAARSVSISLFHSTTSWLTRISSSASNKKMATALGRRRDDKSKMARNPSTLPT